MKKILLVAGGGIIIFLLATPGQDLEDQVEVVQVETRTGIQINYCLEDEVDIFGQLNRNTIDEIIDDILDQVAQEEEADPDLDSTIEEVFEKHGIMDSLRIKKAQEKIKVSYK